MAAFEQARVPEPDALFSRWRALTVALLVTGYAGYYLCRSDLSLTIPLLTAELAAHGISPGDARIRLGGIASLGVLVYALGKFPSGWLTDLLGGRNAFLFGMAGAVACTFLFGFGGGFPIFTVAWIGNRLLQSSGWSSMVKITSRWFSWSAYGTVMGIMSLSFLFGDAAAREFMSLLIARGLGWRGVFIVAASTLGVLLLLNILLLKESPLRIGRPEPPAHPDNLFANHDERATRDSAASLLKTFARNRNFWIVCFLSFGITILRETFNLWTPTYFTQAVGLSVAEAASKSALFPLFGGLSVLLAGFLGDRMGKRGRAAIICQGMLASSAVLLALAFQNFGSQTTPVILVALVAFLMIGPYSYLAGAIALDFGGKKASATASGLIDGAGYLGGVLAGNTFASISVAWGWRGAFLSLAAVAALSSLAALFYFVSQRDEHRLRTMHI